MQATQHVTDRGGHLISMLHEDGRRASAHLLTFEQGSALSKEMANITARLGDFVGVINTANNQFLPNARAEHLRSGAVNVVSKAFIAMQSAGQNETQKINTAKAVAMEVPAATPVTAPLRARTLVKWDAANLAGKAAMINDPELPTEALASLIESGAYKEVPAELQKLVADRWMIENHIRKTGLMADFQTQPDHNNPVATGPDIERCKSFAQNCVNELNARSEAIATVADALRGVVDIVGLATDLPNARAYQLLSTGNIAP